MGQAKSRGNFEERKALSIEKARAERLLRDDAKRQDEIDSTKMIKSSPPAFTQYAGIATADLLRQGIFILKNRRSINENRHY